MTYSFSIGITVNPCKSLTCYSYNPNRINVSTQQKQPPDVFYKNRCSWKFRKIHRKTPVKESETEP